MTAAVGIALSAVSAFGQMQAGRAQAKAYGQQAAMAELQARGEALKYRKQGVDVMDNIIRTTSTIRARAGAGSIDPFSGSAQALSTFALAEGADEFYVTADNQIMAREGGVIQSALLRDQGKQAYRSGLMAAVGTLGKSALSYGGIGGPSGASVMNTGPGGMYFPGGV